MHLAANLTSGIYLVNSQYYGPGTLNSIIKEKYPKPWLDLNVLTLWTHIIFIL